MKRALVAFTSVIVSLLLVGSSAFAAGTKDTKPTKTAPVYLDEIHSPLEHSGTWTSERKPWGGPQQGSAKPGEVSAEGVWWGGIYTDTVSNTLLQNNARRDQAEAFEMLGRGTCMETAESTSLTGTLDISGSTQFTAAISDSFGFSGSGTKTFTKTYKYCGPAEGSQYACRYFYKQLDSNS